MARKQKTNKTDKPTTSKYALKVRARRKLAIQLGLPANTPWPIIAQRFPEAARKAGH